jgi:hypothetical protein
VVGEAGGSGVREDKGRAYLVGCSSPAKCPAKTCPRAQLLAQSSPAGKDDQGRREGNGGKRDEGEGVKGPPGSKPGTKFGHLLPAEPSEFGQICTLSFTHNASITEQTAAKQIHNTIKELCVVDYYLQV